jgi:hypothetical protein
MEQIFLNCFIFKSNIARQPAPYTAKCIDDWSETEYNIQPTVNYSIAVSKLDIISVNLKSSCFKSITNLSR